MARQFLSPLNLLNLASDPGTATEGDLYWNSTTNKLRIYADGAWGDAGSSASSATPISAGVILGSTLVGGLNNTAIGSNALLSVSGTNNVAFGLNAGGLLASGSNNTLIGTDAAGAGLNYLTSGSNNIVIGYSASSTTSTTSNEITLGNDNNNSFRIPGISISADITGITAPAFKKSGGTSSQYLMADGSVSTSDSQQIIPLDDISNQFDGSTNRFLPTYQSEQVTILNPLRLLLTINGIMQYIDFPEYVWMSGVPRKGLFVDYEGYLQFSESVPAGSDFDARVMSGEVTSTRTRVYPFKALDILLGG